MNSRKIVKLWFDRWEKGDFMNLPLSENFQHTSPYGTINGKDQYFKLVNANKDKFLGHHFEIHDEIYDEERACVRYTAVQGDFNLEVSEWYAIRGDKIDKIVAYYNIEEKRIQI